MDGAECDPSNYEGYFLELNVGGPGIAAGVDIGLTDEDYVVTGLSGVNEAGLGAGTPGASVMLCYYVFEGEKG